tara:strand:+ start:900 stop:1184 length:285 start_codon:yes stop_codon:yes gene_type:complete
MDFQRKTVKDDTMLTPREQMLCFKLEKDMPLLQIAANLQAFGSSKQKLMGEGVRFACEFVSKYIGESSDKSEYSDGEVLDELFRLTISEDEITK